MTKLSSKIIIKGEIITLTGLHIGGSKSSLAIGGIDNNVIKSGKNEPYIPGSSLKGKLRSLLAKAAGSLFFDADKQKKELEQTKKAVDKEKDARENDVNDGTKKKSELEFYYDIISNSKNDEDFKYIMELFGYSGDVKDDKKKNVGHTQLFVRDAYLKDCLENKELFKKGEFTQGKWENVIDRKTGTAENPRQTERVPAGAVFDMELVYNVYGEDTAKQQHHAKAIFFALQLLQDDGLGGNISRGYGQVKVKVTDIQFKAIDADKFEYVTLEPSDLNNESQQLLAEFTNEFA